MNTQVRGIPEDVWADVRRIAGEDQTSANLICVLAITKLVDAWRRDEKKRLTKRLDELNQGKLV